MIVHNKTTVSSQLDLEPTRAYGSYYPKWQWQTFHAGTGSNFLPLPHIDEQSLPYPNGW